MRVKRERDTSVSLSLGQLPEREKNGIMMKMNVKTAPQGINPGPQADFPELSQKYFPKAKLKKREK